MQGNIYKFNLKESFNKLRSYCEKEGYKGWDPYDGLNSKVFKATPLKHWDLARLIWIQSFKRNPFNLRKLLLVPKEYNSMGIGLFLNGYIQLYKICLTGNIEFGTLEDLKDKIVELAELLIQLKSPNQKHSCWGYNFDWQARRLFLFPAYTPTVVATTFCASALFEAYAVIKEEKFLNEALSACEFVKNDLNRTPHKGGVIISYSPLNGNNTVFNASLLGAKLLSYGYHYSKNIEYKDLARKAVVSAINSQNKNGSWVYGLLPVQNWIDSFHTGFNLEALYYYQKFTSDDAFKENIKKGYDFYLANFFLENGIPKYYHNQIFPIDIHCPGQFLVTVSIFDEFNQCNELTQKVIAWTIENMQDEKGFFYYQIKKSLSSKISYMRWSNAFMFNALAIYLNFSQKSNE
ncbi:hypothetical protein SAMN00777080_3254 [Aquiflexum balticum DSM 16537]|uniref:Delta-aminolevulinic acid dehydratase n=2 Tax=Aquiflexum TaxID=280472 RepID=A0A1W2H701_9BACT|nr:hypothetical protein SAMN00777080_3254 [Aquiflexum balticum DSM 16537]